MAKPLLALDSPRYLRRLVREIRRYLPTHGVYTDIRGVEKRVYEARFTDGRIRVRVYHGAVFAWFDATHNVFHDSSSDEIVPSRA